MVGGIENGRGEWNGKRIRRVYQVSWWDLKLGFENFMS